MRKDVTAGLYGGHYERKMKHLNKQKEGKKRLKRLAGNIDIPQTAFFDVLSSRPRTFSTSARQSVSFVEHLPEVPQPPPELSLNAERAAPIGRHDLSPEQRSALLSTIMSQTSGQMDLTSEALFANFTRLYLASATNAFTPDELRAIAQTMHAIDRRFKVNMRSANERFETVVNALRETAGNSAEAIRGLELAILVSGSRAQRHVPQPVLRKAESMFMALYPTPPKPSGMAAYRMCLNHVLYLCALARSPGRLNAWWGKMIREGVAPDSWSYLSRILVYGGMLNVDAAMAELAFTLPKVEGADALVLVNAALWMAIRGDRWDAAGALHAALSARAPDIAARALLDAGLPESLAEQLTALTPDRVTSAILVEAHTFRGDLLAALNALRGMFADGHAPGVGEYMAMFHGFARHGVIGSGPAGDAAAAFPFWHDNHAASGLDNPWGDEEPGHFSSNYRPSVWTQAALEELFASFLALPPPRATGRSLPRAPSANAVYRTLLAFGRVTNSDGRAVRAALAAMAAKFGPGNEEGWVGWHEDKRHKRLRAVLGME
jgi:hypothetical protein